MHAKVKMIQGHKQLGHDRIVRNVIAPEVAARVEDTLAWGMLPTLCESSGILKMLGRHERKIFKVQ